MRWGNTALPCPLLGMALGHSPLLSGPQFPLLNTRNRSGLPHKVTRGSEWPAALEKLGFPLSDGARRTAVHGDRRASPQPPSRRGASSRSSGPGCTGSVCTCRAGGRAGSVRLRGPGGPVCQGVSLWVGSSTKGQTPAPLRATDLTSRYLDFLIAKWGSCRHRSRR